MAIAFKYYYCKNCEQNMVKSTNEGVPYSFCRDCQIKWIEEQMRRTPGISWYEGEQKAR